MAKTVIGMITQPLISVVMAVFNGQNYLALSIESILRQSHSNLEFIIINDGSNDNSLEIIKKYQQSDGRIQIISRENKGLAYSLNEGISLASGDWIARMDADDIALPTRFENQLSWLNFSGADICGTWIEFFDSASSKVQKYPQTDLAIKVGLLFGCMLAHPTVMAKAALMKQFQYDSAWNKAEDYELWTRIALSGAKMTNIPMTLLRYRIHSSQISVASNAAQKRLTQEVRSAYWGASHLVNGVDLESAGEFLRIYDSQVAVINMNKVDQCLGALLENTYGEARDITYQSGEIAYLKASQLDGSAISRWRKMCRQYDLPFPISVQLFMFAAASFKFVRNKYFSKLGRYFYMILRG